MDLLIVPVPLFNEENQVDAYMFKYSRGNTLLAAATDSIHLDGAMRSPILDAVATVGLEALTMGRPVFVPISKYALMAGPEANCAEAPEKIIFLLEAEAFRDEAARDGARRLRGLGYRFAVRGMAPDEAFLPALDVCDFVLHEQKRFGEPAQVKLRALIAETCPAMGNVYVGVDSMEVYQGARQRYKGLYEGRFYRTPLSEGGNKVSPLQVNMINLLNKIRGESFDFDEAAAIIHRDPALTVSLLRMVNTVGRRESGVEIKTINGAVVMLGENETRKWIMAAAANQLAVEKPTEIAKLSLIRAQFADALAGMFGLGEDRESLFLMGVFSVLDVMLEMPMAEALELVPVSADIKEALTGKTGKYGDVHKFLLDYEAADWDAASRMMILKDLKAAQIYKAYIDALCWYRDMLSQGDGTAGAPDSGRPAEGHASE
ncbi:MAG: HDOD domain-containing protein [Clostridiales Family XIII bacterium]|jgi:EAL and modified HD-GYP domain-containing signal transduction protein|nr:HDOD domain-containing protein [Clostridiales Family XIII bacterium]